MTTRTMRTTMNKDNSLGGKSESRISEAEISAIMQIISSFR